MRKLCNNLWWLKFDEQEAEELEMIYNHYIDKRKETLTNTSFKVEDIFGDIISEDSLSPEQIFKLKCFLSKIV